MEGTSELLLPTLRCFRCGHTWIPNKLDIHYCPKCKGRLIFTRCLTCKKSMEDSGVKEHSHEFLSSYISFVSEHSGDNHKLVSYIYKKKKARKIPS